ncbi:MAG: hypothetical protein Q9204_003608 [Flavoplaca sp. TL-2023a]
MTALLPSRYNDTGRQFISLEDRPDHPKIIAVLLGGSSIYRKRNDCCENDWDGAIIVPEKLDIVQLVNDQRSSMMEMLGIVQAECPEFKVPNESSPHWTQFDCVRFAGFDKLQTKRSVKILSLDYFFQPNNSIRILSFKDKRIFEACRPPAIKYYRVQQARRVENGLLILQDQWVYTASTNQQQDAFVTAFGVTADLLLTGFWLYGQHPHGRLIQKHILARYTNLSELHANTQSFAKHQLFSSEYCDWLAEELSDLYDQPEMPIQRPRSQLTSLKQTFVCGEAITAPDQDFTKPPTQGTTLPSWFRRLSTQAMTGDPLQRQELPLSAFSSNSTAAKITLPAVSAGEVTSRIFSKCCQYPEQELQGARNAAAFGLHVQLPLIMPSGELWYPFFDGKTESELRLSCHHDGWSNGYAIEALLYAELVKAEDMLRLYRRCITDTEEENEILHIENCHLGTTSSRGTTKQPIHRFFYARLLNDERFHQFYERAIPVGQDLSLEEFLKFLWKVNGVTYPSLGELFDTARNILHPNSPQCKSCPTVFGLGDAHGANVIISDHVLPNNSREVLYVDYEAAGFHPVMLDLAKPFYNDVFFDTLYLDLLPKTPKMTYAIEGDLINVSFTPYVDDLTQAVFDVKHRFLLQPLFGLVKDCGGGHDLGKDIPLLSNALLCCATLTRDFSGHPDAFVRNLATGTILAQAVDLEGLYSGFKSLGLNA